MEMAAGSVPQSSLSIYDVKEVYFKLNTNLT
jgi:hypothetical protein